MPRILLSSLLAGLVATTPLTAETDTGVVALADPGTGATTPLVGDDGGGERINFSGKMRMLTQRIAASACYSHAGVSQEASTAMLGAASAEFAQILTGLRVGDASLGINGIEEDRQVLADLDQADALWAGLSGDLTALAGGSDAEQVASVALQTEATLDVAKHLVSVITGEYSDPAALLQVDALTIDIAGRQRMLAQRISKNVCLLSNGIEVEGAADQLAGAVRVYQASVNALRNGLPEAGVSPPPNDVVANGLDAIIADWNAVQPILTTVMDGGEISMDDQATIFAQMNSLTGQMNTLVGIYTEESKLGL